jgi:hypothetical protein
MADIARLITRADEVMGAGRHIWNLHRQAGATSTFVNSLDDVAKATVNGAKPGQPIGILRAGTQIELVPLDAARKGAATASPHNWPSLGGLTIRAESVHALDDALVGVTHMGSHGRLGRMLESGVVPRSAVY